MKLTESIMKSLTEDEKTLDVKSPMKLNTGVLPILDANLYGREDALWTYNEDTEEEEGPDMDTLKSVMIKGAQPILERELKTVLPSIKVKVTDLWRPKYYNYSGDELEFTVNFDPKEFNFLMDQTVKDPKFEEYLKNKYRSYDGFISNMAEDLDEFWSQEGWKKFVQVVMFYLQDLEKNNDINMEFWDYVVENC